MERPGYPPASEDGFRIDREGAWHYGGNEIPRRELVRILYQNLHRDEEGRYFIEIGPQRCSVDVDDTAYSVWAVYWTERGVQTQDRIQLLLSDGSVEELDPGTLRVGRENILYCRVKRSRFDARFSRSSYYRLAERIEYDPSRNAHCLRLRGRTHYIAEP
jgi:hypothetical protein